MENPSSPLETLRQLKEMLDSGALTPTEFEALKQRLVFAPAPVASDNAAAALPPASVLPPLPPVAPVAAADAVVDATAASLPPVFPNSYATLGALATTPEPSHVWAEPASAPAPDYRGLPGAAPALPSPVREAEQADEETHSFADKDDQFMPAPERSSSLGLILAIGAVLVFLAVVAYLGFNRPPSEHLSSTSQTAADSLKTAIETGPQAAPLPAAAAEPETVRIAPAHPAPALPSPAEMARQAAAIRDSADHVIPPPADSAGHQ